MPRILEVSCSACTAGATSWQLSSEKGKLGFAALQPHRGPWQIQETWGKGHREEAGSWRS